MGLFTNCGFESGDLTNWDTTDKEETGSGSVTIVASIGAATYGSYGCYICCDTGGTGKAETHTVATVDLTSVSIFSFDYAIPEAVVGDGPETTHHGGFDVYLIKEDLSETYSLIGEEGIYFSPDYPATTSAWTHVDFDCSALSGNYKVSINAYAGDYTSG